MPCSAEQLLFMPRHQKVAGYYVIPSEILSVRPSVCLGEHLGSRGLFVYDYAVYSIKNTLSSP